MIWIQNIIPNASSPAELNKDLITCSSYLLTDRHNSIVSVLYCSKTQVRGQGPHESCAGTTIRKGVAQLLWHSVSASAPMPARLLRVSACLSWATSSTCVCTYTQTDTTQVITLWQDLSFAVCSSSRDKEPLWFRGKWSNVENCVCIHTCIHTGGKKKKTWVKTSNKHWSVPWKDLNCLSISLRHSHGELCFIKETIDKILLRTHTRTAPPRAGWTLVSCIKYSQNGKKDEKYSW